MDRNSLPHTEHGKSGRSLLGVWKTATHVFTCVSYHLKDWYPLRQRPHTQRSFWNRDPWVSGAERTPGVSVAGAACTEEEEYEAEADGGSGWLHEHSDCCCPSTSMGESRTDAATSSAPVPSDSSGCLSGAGAKPSPGSSLSAWATTGGGGGFHRAGSPIACRF